MTNSQQTDFQTHFYAECIKTYDEALKGLERAGWPCTLPQLPDLYVELGVSYTTLKEILSHPDVREVANEVFGQETINAALNQ